MDLSFKLVAHILTAFLIVYKASAAGSSIKMGGSSNKVTSMPTLVSFWVETWNLRGECNMY